MVALRDGLYQACEAYANGMIGRRAYALILSQYGNVLIQLLQTPASGASGGGASAASGASPATVNVALSASPSGGGASAPSATKTDAAGAGSTSAASAQLALLQQAHIQALVVACLNEFDPSMPDNLGGGRTEEKADAADAGSAAPIPSRTPAAGLPGKASDGLVKRDYDDDAAPALLTHALCKQLLHNVVDATPALLKPAASSGGKTSDGGGSACGRAAATLTTEQRATMQKTLSVLKLYKNTPRGRDDASFKSAVTIYQARQGVCADGVVDKITLAQLTGS